VRILYRSVLLQILEDYKGEHLQASPVAELLLSELDKKAKAAKTEMFLEECQNDESLQDASVIQDFVVAGCSQEFQDFLKGHLEARLYPKGKLITDFYRSTGKRSLHMLSRGKAVAVQDDQSHQDIEPGQVFGRMASLGLSIQPEFCAQAYASSHCCTQVLHQSMVVRALELFPDQQSTILRLDKNVIQGADFRSILQGSPFFSNMNPAFVGELSHVAVDRIFMPGDNIVTEGQDGDSMFIMVAGSADVYMTGKIAAQTNMSNKKRESASVVQHSRSVRHMTRVGRLLPGAICGELAMLGVTKTRAATIQASQLCVMWEVTQESAHSILNRYTEERDLFGQVIVQNLDITVPTRILQMPLFKGFDRKFRVLLTLYCERFAFFPEKVVVREGEAGDRLWILNLGPAMLQKRGFT
ncbi:unnamed protein product, partial [Polarella glacialis]